MNKLKGTVQKLNKMTSVEMKRPVITPVIANTSGRDKYRNYHRSGPELLVSKIISINGPLTSKEIWRIYQRMLVENQQAGNPEELEYWPSLTKLKETLKFMRMNEKIKSNGYSRKEHMHLGWKLNSYRAYKFVHPEIVADIEAESSRKDEL